MQASSRPANWTTLLANSIARVADGDPAAFGTSLVEWLRRMVAFDHCVIFGYGGTMPPPVLFDTFTPEESVMFVAQYQDGPYLLDPFFHAATAAVQGFRRMRDLAPDRFYASEYFRSYYSQTGLAEEVGFFIPLEGENSAVVSLMRLQRSGVFGTADVRQFRDLAPLVAALVRLQWPRLLHVSGSGGASRLPGYDRKRAWEGLGLTAREGQVVEHVLQGHSTESIARVLGIATGTVKVHRRNIHKTLGIRSQAELFVRFLRTIGARM